MSRRTTKQRRAARRRREKWVRYAYWTPWTGFRVRTGKVVSVAIDFMMVKEAP